MSNLFDEIKKIEDVEIKEAEDLRKYSTLQLKGVGNIILLKSKKAISKVIQKLQGHPYRLLGLGANQLLPEFYEGFYLKLSLPFKKSYLEQVHDIYKLPASLSLASLTSHASKFGLIDWEVFTGIPATLGGAIFMNAGTNLGEISQIVHKVFYIDKYGNEKEHLATSDSFSYRRSNFLEEGDVVYQVELKNNGVNEQIKKIIRDYLLKRNESQPMKEKTCGCVFKNSIGVHTTCRAGEYIDIMGLKGLTYGDLMISPLHANFIINMGDGTKEQMLSLIKTIQNELYLQYGIEFDTEVRF